MPGVSIHVVDVARGTVAAGMQVSLDRIETGGRRTRVASGNIGPNGSLEDARLAERMLPGNFEASFHVAEYYRQQGVALPNVPFLDVANYCFGISDADAHYHLPFKCTPWGYSCFRGGA